MARRNNQASDMALGGVLAALAVIIMCLGCLIPGAGFLCVILCILMTAFIRKKCGGRIGWAWYAVVAILSALLGPDKEAAALFLFLGYYPLIKPKLDALPLRWLWKGLLFNAAILVMYWVLLRLLGMEELVSEFEEMGKLLTLLTLILGNITFFLLDRLLKMRAKK